MGKTFIFLSTASRELSAIYSSYGAKLPFEAHYICYGGKYYALTEKRIAYMRDKTMDGRFFILTLFAIAYEIEANNAYSPDDIIDVQLLIGLPSAHYAKQREQFQAYFVRDEFIEFCFNGKYTILIDRVFAAPQALAAIMPVFGQVKDISKGVIIDIGGMTADYIMVRKGVADASV